MKDYLLAPRPEVLTGYTYRTETPCGTLFLTLNDFNGHLFEVRIIMGKAGNCTSTLFQSLALFLSVLLQTNIPREKIAKTLEKRFDCYCANPFWKDKVKYNSCIDFIFKKMLEDMASREEIKIEEESKEKDLQK